MVSLDLYSHHNKRGLQISLSYSDTSISIVLKPRLSVQAVARLR